MAEPSTQASLRPATIQRTGGTWDSRDRPLYFTATQSAAMRNHILDATDAVLLDAHEVRVEGDQALLEDWVHTQGKKLLIDSGVHNYVFDVMRRTGLDYEAIYARDPAELPGFARFRDRYLEVVARYGAMAWGYIELDLGDGASKAGMRAEMVAAGGLVPIPAWHGGADSFDVLDDLLTRYDRIALSGVLSLLKVGLRRLMTVWEHVERLNPDVWIHLLGYTANQFLHAYPCVGSCDSSNWTSSVQWKGHYPRLDNVFFGYMPFGFRHARGVAPTHPAGTRRAEQMGVYGNYFESLTWRAHQQGWNELMRE